MPRAFLIHWNEGEAKQHAWRVRRSGWSVGIGSREGGEAVREIAKSPPDAVVIYLSRLPSHGARVAELLGEREGTRRVPLVFVDGDRETVSELSERFPHAVFTSSEELGRTLGSLTQES